MMALVAVTVKVTNEDIAYGVKQSCLKCPVAIAATRALGGAALVTVRSTVAYCHIDKAFYAARLPVEAVRFITGFDDGKDVEPLKFNLDFIRQYEL